MFDLCHKDGMEITQRPFYSEWSVPNLVLQVFQWFIIAIINSIQLATGFLFHFLSSYSSIVEFSKELDFHKICSKYDNINLVIWAYSEDSELICLVIHLCVFLGYWWYCKDSPPTTKLKLSITFFFVSSKSSLCY